MNNKVRDSDMNLAHTIADGICFVQENDSTYSKWSPKGFYHPDRIGWAMLISQHVNQETENIQIRLNKTISLLRDLQNDMIGIVGPITWAEDNDFGKKGDPVGMHVASDIRYRIAEASLKKINDFFIEV